MAKFVLEGEWSGYTSAQRHIVHREIVDSKRADRLRRIHKIPFSDGTWLLLSIRAAAPREKVAEVLGYRSLIRDTERSAAQ